MTTYYDLTASTRLIGAPLEGFGENLNFNNDAPSNLAMLDPKSSNIKDMNLQKNWKAINNPDGKLDTSVSNPFGYGYMPSLTETRNEDAKEILAQQTTNFALGAVAGVSLIVIGIIMASGSNAASPSSS